MQLLRTSLDCECCIMCDFIRCDRNSPMIVAKLIAIEASLQAASFNPMKRHSPSFQSNI
jgi:hypothetical protein